MTAGRTNSNSVSKSWCTPRKFVEVITDFFGGKIDFDPCSNDDSIVNANVEIKLPIDGLSVCWNYKHVFVNPPYGRDNERKTTIKNWLKKCADSHKEFNSEVIALVPVATNTSHWKEYVYNNALSICFIYDTRVKFIINGDDENKGAPMACCFIYWGKNYEEFKNFFSKLGYVVKL